MDKDGRIPPGKKEQIALLKKEYQPFKFGFVLKGRDTEVLTIGCDYRNLKFIMDTIELRIDFIRWFPSRETIESEASKLYGAGKFHREVYERRSSRT